MTSATTDTDGRVKMGEEEKNSLEIEFENRPAIFVLGSSNVGKRTLLSRLLSVDFEEASDSSSDFRITLCGF